MRFKIAHEGLTPAIEPSSCANPLIGEVFSAFADAEKLVNERFFQKRRPGWLARTARSDYSRGLTGFGSQLRNLKPNSPPGRTYCNWFCRPTIWKRA